MNWRQLRRQQQQLNQPPKIQLMFSKQKGIQSKTPTYIQHREYDVNKDTKCCVYFNASYTDPNLRFNEVTES